jgi:NhaA family Na+:H+ antiporter
MTEPPRRRALFSRGSTSEIKRISTILRTETAGGVLLLVAASAALIWANSPWGTRYHALAAMRVGTDVFGLHLNLTMAEWSADALLAIFFFVVGLELKREFVAGDLREPARAVLPIAAAVGGMVVPALIFVMAAGAAGDGALRGWAIPTATDIAFAVAVLAVISTHLPAALRTFLLTLAVVADLLAITVIAVFYTKTIHPIPLSLALVPLALFAFLVQRRVRSPWLLIPLALVTWVLVHSSGVHATVAGVLLGFTVPVLAGDLDSDSSGVTSSGGPAEHFEHVLRPVSAGFAVPVFAFFSAGVTFGGWRGLAESLGNPIAIGIVGGLVVGKTIGVFGTTRVLSACTRAALDPALRWIDVFGISVLAGVGFTVSLLIGELAYGSASTRDDIVKTAVLVGSLLAAGLAAIVLRLRNRHYRAAFEREELDDADDM